MGNLPSQELCLHRATQKRGAYIHISSRNLNSCPIVVVVEARAHLMLRVHYLLNTVVLSAP